MTTTLIDEIREKCSTELLASRDCAAITAAFNAGRKRIEQPHFVGDGTVSNALGRPTGPLFVLWLQRAASEHYGVRRVLQRHCYGQFHYQRHALQRGLVYRRRPGRGEHQHCDRDVYDQSHVVLMP